MGRAGTSDARGAGGRQQHQHGRLGWALISPPSTLSRRHIFEEVGGAHGVWGLCSAPGIGCRQRLPATEIACLAPVGGVHNGVGRRHKALWLLRACFIVPGGTIQQRRASASHGEPQAQACRRSPPPPLLHNLPCPYQHCVWATTFVMLITCCTLSCVTPTRNRGRQHARPLALWPKGGCGAADPRPRHTVFCLQLGRRHCPRPVLGDAVYSVEGWTGRQGFSQLEDGARERWRQAGHRCSGAAGRRAVA